jgi:hypothetical protein
LAQAATVRRLDDANLCRWVPYSRDALRSVIGIYPAVQHSSQRHFRERRGQQHPHTGIQPPTRARSL